MTNQELIAELKKILPDYVFTGGDYTTDCIHGVKQLAPQTFRDSKKSLVKSENRVIFISSEMYPNTDKNFRYAMNYTKSKIDKRTILMTKLFFSAFFLRRDQYSKRRVILLKMQQRSASKTQL